MDDDVVPDFVDIVVERDRLASSVWGSPATTSCCRPVDLPTARGLIADRYQPSGEPVTHWP
jgi:hypothetical protein